MSRLSMEETVTLVVISFYLGQAILNFSKELIGKEDLHSSKFSQCSVHLTLKAQIVAYFSEFGQANLVELLLVA